MTRIKKVGIGILLGIMIIFGMQGMSNAYFVGQNLTITYNQYDSSNNIFCVEHGQALTVNNDYKIISNVKIEGKKSIDHEGKIIDNWHNAKFAYILSADNGANHDSGPVQNEIWNYGYTWMNNVGKNHNGLSQGFISSVKGNSNTETKDLDKDATNYANNIVNGKKVTDNTKKENIKVEAYDKDGKQYMRIGPFNWSFAGKLTEISVYDQESNIISDKLYSIFTGKTEKWINVEDIKSDKDFYISIPTTSGVSKITKVSGKMSIDVKAVNIWFLESTTGYNQNLIIRDPYNGKEDISISLDYNIPMLGNLKVIKVNEHNVELKLPNVGFYIQNKNTGKYLKEGSNRTVSYVDDKNQATEFVTDLNGQITIKNLIVGTYVAYETKNPNYGYEIISEGKEKEVVVDKTAELQIPNPLKYIKLSGYVWVDKISGKQSNCNDLFKDNDYDSGDILLDGIIVKLKDKSGNVIKETKTANGGAYKFIDVLIEDLDKYHVEFEYDGLTYTNVVAHIDKDNGSKSVEKSIDRDNFNKDFSVVEGKTSNTSMTRDNNNKEKYTITYNLDQNAHIATLNNTGLYPITANTDEAGYSIKAHYVVGQEEIKNINLGLYERDQPDIALLKDLENIKLSVNGYNHVYTYANRFNNEGTYKQGFNVGVKFGTGTDEYGNMKYSRPIYKADYDEFVNKEEDNKELKVYVTYRIRVVNESSNLQVAVNEIVDYYDARYTIVKAGTELEGYEPKGNIVCGDSTRYNDKYQKVIINANTGKIAGTNNGNNYRDIYVQFELNKEAKLNILNDKENLDNVAEINSYSVFNENGNVYAGIDKDSNPGNAIPGDRKTYQDDTDSAPGLKLEVAGEREMSGKVFLDSTSDKLMTGEVRQGSGKYEDGEKGIAGVEVTLTETTGTGKSYKTKTLSASDINQSGLYGFVYNEETGIYEVEEYNKEKASKYAYTNVKEEANGKPKPEPMLEEGDFLIKGFIPGDYTLTYTWGDKTYTVQDYKGTIYDKNRKQDDKNWHKENIDARLTDAIDNFGRRLEIDSGEKITKMDSTTPIMGIGIEKDADGNTRFGITQIETVSNGDKFVTPDFKVKNVDFGIVERARQSLDIAKRVKTFKVTLANGQVIVDVIIEKDGTIKGEKKGLIYMGPSSATSNGLVKLELDSELIQGSTAEIGYEIVVKNNSELDYDYEEFYKYGINGTKEQIIKIKPVGIYDYLDNKLVFNKENNSDWDIKTIDKYNTDVSDATIIEQYLNKYHETTTDSTGIKTTIEGYETYSKTYKEIIDNWKNETIKTSREKRFADKTILYNAKLEAELEPNTENAVSLNVSKILANTDEIELNNDIEITKVNREQKTGRNVTPIHSTLYNTAETVTVTPPTGGNINYIVVVGIVISALIIIGTGIVFIKKKVIE